MLSPFITGIFALYFYKFLNDNQSKLTNFLIVSTSLVITTLSTSTTAYVTLIILLSYIILFSKPYKLKKGFRIFIIKNKIKAYATVLLSILIVFSLFTHFTIGWSALFKIVDLYLLDKQESVSFSSRTTADIHALKLFLESYGLGVGLGSNRPSSLIPYLLSQCGIIGTFMFFYFIFSILKFTYNSLKGTQYFGYFFLLPAVLIAQLTAYPDITNPTLWQFIYITIIISLWRSKYETLH